MYNLQIRIASELLKEYGEKYLGGEIGFTMVLHTWGQTMQQHPHSHFIVTGGALVSNPDGTYRWQAATRNFLFPVKLLSKEFRDRFCAAVEQLGLDAKLQTGNDGVDIAQIVEQARAKNWEVYIQSPLYDTEKLIEYLGRYVFRIAISNHRIVSVTDTTVTFQYFDNRDEGKPKLMTLPVMEFIRRFLSHVLPDGFVRIRHFGLHHGTCRAKLQQARRSLGIPSQLPTKIKLLFLDWFKKIMQTDQDPRLCKSCGVGIMTTIREFGPVYGWRLKLHAILGAFTHWKNVFT